MVAMLLERVGEKYQLSQGMIVPEVPSIDSVMVAVNGFYKQDQKFNGLIIVIDTWGHPPHIRDQIEKDRAESVRQLNIGEISLDEYNSAHKAIVAKYKRPSDYRQEVRSEMTQYIAATDDGVFLAAEQRRGIENELYWFGGPDSPEPDNEVLTDRISMLVRLIVERTE